MMLARATAVMAQLTAQNTPLVWDRNPLEAGLGGCPWRVCISAIIRFNSSEAQARLTLRALLGWWPTPDKLAPVPLHAIATAVAGHNLPYRRARMVRAFSRAWVAGDWQTVLDLPGINQLALAMLAAHGPQSHPTAPAAPRG